MNLILKLLKPNKAAMKDTIQLNRLVTMKWTRSFNILDGELFAMATNINVGVEMLHHLVRDPRRTVIPVDPNPAEYIQIQIQVSYHSHVCQFLLST